MKAPDEDRCDDRARRPSTHDAVRALVEAGVDAVRLNLSHGTHEDHAARVQVVREVQEEVGRPLALIADLQGPKLRIGDLDEPRRLVRTRASSSSASSARRTGSCRSRPP